MKKIMYVLLAGIMAFCSLGLSACDQKANDDMNFTVRKLIELLQLKGWTGTIEELFVILGNTDKEIDRYEFDKNGNLVIYYTDGTSHVVVGHKWQRHSVIQKAICGQEGCEYYICTECESSKIVEIEPPAPAHHFENGYCDTCKSYIGGLAAKKINENAYFLGKIDSSFDLYVIGSGDVSLADISKVEAKNVKGIYLAQGITSLSDIDFKIFTNLEIVYVEEGNTSYYVENNGLYRSEDQSLIVQGAIPTETTGVVEEQTQTTENQE